MFVLGVIVGVAVAFAANMFFSHYKITEKKQD